MFSLVLKYLRRRCERKGGIQVSGKLTSMIGLSKREELFRRASEERGCQSSFFPFVALEQRRVLVDDVWQ
jgi:hypothetical protein